jgi:hypothetical protein
LNDELELTEPGFVDFAYYGEFIAPGVERPPRDAEKPLLRTFTDYTARARSEKKTHSVYDEYLHIGRYAFFDNFANAATCEGLDRLSARLALSPEQTTPAELIIAGHRIHNVTEEATRARRGFLRLTSGGHESTDNDRV